MNEVEKFWNNAHLIDSLGSLSGCTYDETVNFLQINDYVKSGIKILEVGCGLGYVTAEFSKLGDVSVLDISEAALTRVQSFCESTYTASESNQLPNNYFDLIICTNVVQHVPTSELKRELVDIINSLKEDGLFAIQFVSIDNVDDIQFPTVEDSTAGKLGRSPEFMHQIINESGGVSKEISSSRVKNKIINQNNVFHISKGLKK
jgi:SAM-dependent methyltransferase